MFSCVEQERRNGLCNAGMKRDARETTEVGEAKGLSANVEGVGQPVTITTEKLSNRFRGNPEKMDITSEGL